MYLYDYAQKLVSDLSLHRRLDKVDNSIGLFIAGIKFCRQIHGLSYSWRTVWEALFWRAYVLLPYPGTNANSADRRLFTPTLHDLNISIITNQSKRLHMESYLWELLIKEVRACTKPPACVFRINSVFRLWPEQASPCP